MRHLFACAAIVLVLCSAVAMADALPDSARTPGITNPDVTPDNAIRTICVPRYSKHVRPSAAYTNRLKKQQIREYGYADRKSVDYEEDHLISIELGGNPTDPRNLWPQPRHGQWNAARKDRIENELHRRVCAGQMTLRAAQYEIATDWIKAYRQYIGSQ